MVLHADSLTLTINDERRPIFHDIDMHLNDGNSCLLKGGPGSGKSLLGLTLCGLLPLWVGRWNLVGSVSLFGEIVQQGNPPGGIGILLENPYNQLSGLKKSVRCEIAFSLECLGVSPDTMSGQIDTIANEFGIFHLLDRDVRTLSGGELQRVLISAMLISKPRFLFLDRPLTEIDTDYRPEIMKLVDRHVTDSDGAILTAEDPWLLEGTTFNTMINLDGSGNHVHCPAMKLSGAPLSDETVIETERLSFAYEEGRPVITDLSFTLKRGEVVFVTGSNGAGKTTLARLITGIRKPNGGTIFIDGEKAGLMPEWERFSRVGYALQNTGYHLSRNTVREELALSFRAGFDTQESAKTLGLEGLLDSHPLELTQAERKRLGVALSFGGKRSAVILDEPTQYQDGEGFEKIVTAIEEARKKDTGIMIITHDPRFDDTYPDAKRITLS